jgi:hypothetical protein
MTPLRWLALLSCGFLALRLLAATQVGFGDAEALYVAYALHPRLVHQDHPGLVGAVAWLVGAGAPPTPLALHLLTSLAATAIPWAAALAARWLGAPRDRAPLAGLALLAAPQITIGLFALTPDLLLAPCWLLASGTWGRALILRAQGLSPLRWALLASALAGLAAASKVSGFLLLLAMALSLSTPSRDRPVPLSPVLAPLALGALLASPVLLGELMYGFSMLRHRLVSTQQQAGFSLRNAGALVGGQLAYLSPLVFLGALGTAGWLRKQTAVPPRWLWILTCTAGLPLATLCLWSRVAEPHWLAPALLPLALAAALPQAPDSPGPRLRRWALGLGAALSTLVFAWTLTDLAPRYLGPLYEGRYDLANDLKLWQKVAPRLQQLRLRARLEQGPEPLLLTPHWIVAAQATATGAPGLRASTLACLPGAADPPDDFCSWEPPSGWPSAPLLWVSDDRFELKPPPWLQERGAERVERVELVRGGRVVRVAELWWVR